MERIFDFYVPEENKAPLGRLKSLGVTSDELAPLLFPRKYNDLRDENIIKSFSVLGSKINEKVYVQCQLVGTPQVSFDPKDKTKPPVTKFAVRDDSGMMLSTAVFGPSKELVENLKSNKLFCLRADVDVWNNNLQLKNVEWVDSKWMGRIMPVYPGKTKQINPETVQDRMTVLVDQNINDCLGFLKKQFNIKSPADEHALLLTLGIKNPKINFFQVLKSIHAPVTPAIGFKAQEVFKRLAAREIVNSLNSMNATCVNPASSIKVPNHIIRQVIKDMPPQYKLTNGQVVAIKEMLADIASDTPMRRLLTGDVGTGKSLPIAIAAAIMARMGKNVVILMPNEPLAEQMRKDIETWWPDTEPKLVANSTKNKKVLPKSHILVGTTALNFRVTDDYPVDLLMIDEQQKMSVQQRLALSRDYTNVLEASATPLPRSLALIKFGGLPISTLREAYVEKDITTSLVENKLEDKRQLFMDVKKCVMEGNQALIIYPLAETAEVTDDISSESIKRDKKSAEGAFSIWEGHFPGRVRFAHGKQKSADKLANINALNNNEADILCSTTVVEVGLNVPKLRYVVVVHPERLGLSTLHQIRGRLCRNGGSGTCVLYLPDPVSEKTMKRLQVFCKSNDGFMIAAADMRLRGMGDISNKSEIEQSGFIDMSFLPSQKLTVENFEWATKNLTPKNDVTEDNQAGPSMR